MFQTIINKILQDLINTKKIVSFINNMIVEIGIEKGYEKVIKEIVED